MKSRILAIMLLALGVGLAGIGPAVSDMVITLRDGRVVRVPVDADDIRSLTFEDAAAAQAPAAPAPAEAPAAQAPAASAAPAVAETDLAALVVPVPAESRKLDAAPIQVGPTRKYKVPSQAAKMARDGAVIEIDAGTYPGDVAVWPQSHLTIRGVGGLAHMAAGGNAAGGKAIWVFRGDNITVENVELSGCEVPDRNGAGIRFEGANLIIRNSYIHDNQMGILTSRNFKSDILIEYSEFADNIVDYEATGSLGHNIYVGEARNFTLRGSYVHGASIGHNVKSRAHFNRIEACWIHDSANRELDLVDGAGNTDVPGSHAVLVGNLIVKAREMSGNRTVIHFGQDGGKDHQGTIWLVHNTIVTPYIGPVVELSAPGTSAEFHGNIVHGAGAGQRNQVLVAGRAGGRTETVRGGANWIDATFGVPEGSELAKSRRAPAPGEASPFVDPANGKFRLRRVAGSAAIDAGVPLARLKLPVEPFLSAPAKASGLLEFDSESGSGTRPRPDDGKPDLGAFEAR